MDIEEVRRIVVEEAESHYWFSDEYGFSKIAKEEIVEEGDGVAVARFRIELQDNTALQILIDRVCARISDEPRVFMDMREQYGLMYYECVWVMNFAGKTDAKNLGQSQKIDDADVNEQESRSIIETETEPDDTQNQEEQGNGLEDRMEDREDQDFDSSQYYEEMFV